MQLRLLEPCVTVRRDVRMLGRTGNTVRPRHFRTAVASGGQGAVSVQKDDAPVPALPWFHSTFCQDRRYIAPTSAAVVPWHSFWFELHKLAQSEGLNEVSWSFIDHKLSQPSQREVFTVNLWTHVWPSQRNSITAEEFEAAVDVFSKESGSMADLIESIMLNKPGSRANPTLQLRDQAFLSHTGRDSALDSVNLPSTLYRELRDKHSLLVFMDMHSIAYSEQWRQKMEACVRRSKVFVVFLTPQYFSRYWCMHELDLALHADPTPERRVVIPVLLGVDHNYSKQAKQYRRVWEGFHQVSTRDDATDVLDRWEHNLELLDGLQPVNCADFGGKGWMDKVVEELADIVRKHMVAVLGNRQSLLSRLPQLYWAPQARHNVHDVLPDDLVVNEAAFKELTGSIEAACSKQAQDCQQVAATAGGDAKSCKVAPPVVQLLGMEGMGTSTLALQIAHHYEDTVGCFTGTVHFLRVPPESTVAADKEKDHVMQMQHSLLQQLFPFAAGEKLDPKSSPDDLHLKLTNAFASEPLQHRVHLLVLDGVWDDIFIRQLRCSSMRGVVLVTAQASVWAPAAAAGSNCTLHLRADDDTRSAARALMMNVLRKAHRHIQPDMQDIADGILHQCDGNMRATSLMANALTTRSAAASWEMVSKDFMKRLEVSTPIISATHASLDSLKRAPDLDKQRALTAFDMLQHLQCRLPLPWQLLQLLWNVLHPSEDYEDIKALLTPLVQASLLCYQPDVGYYAPSVVDSILANEPYQADLKALSAASDARQLNKLAVMLLGYGRESAVIWAQQLLNVQPADGTPISFVRVLKEKVLPVPKWEFQKEPEGSLNLLLGQVHDEDGQYSKADIFFRRSLALTDEPHGQPDLKRATAAYDLGVMCMAQGRLRDAEDCLRYALSIRQRLLGEGHPDTVMALSMSGMLLTRQGKLEEAERIHLQAAHACEEALGPFHPATAFSCNRRGLLRYNQGMLSEAESLYRRALAIGQDLRPSHPYTANSLNLLASLLHAQGKLEEAAPLYEAALQIREKALARNNPDTACTRDSLGALYEEQGKWEEAEPLYRRALSIREAVLGPSHPDTLDSRKNLAKVLQKQGKLEEAETLLRQVFDAQMSDPGPSNPDTVSSATNLAGVLYAKGRKEEASSLCELAWSNMQGAFM